MTIARTCGVQLGYEWRSFRRNPAAATFTVAFPLVLLLVVGSLTVDATSAPAGGRFEQFFVPAVAAFAVMSACYTNLAMTLVLRRDSGLLKQARTTPVPATVLVGGLVVHQLLIAMALGGATLAIGTAAYGLDRPGDPLIVLVTMVVGAGSFSAMALAIVALLPNADAAPAVVNGVFFPVVIASGLLFPVRPGSLLASFSELLPVRHFLLGMHDAYSPVTGNGPATLTHLVVMLAWGLAAAVVVRFRFQWETRT
ncbi:hypothetical protein DQ237_12190 [Blastococcus sp. TF02-8]|uniref:ABC transporter permease n=1 Tax=Blastococcus sp. TF02-8 TaxID=2250574 RepID=UPI000DEA8E29|nr:ABC transporter permease [Blastococcus sp. TF02-8]RBY95893.1 hypothetical protein DQ237_12190 [Blastococcus sp. TF02-8]